MFQHVPGGGGRPRGAGAGGGAGGGGSKSFPHVTLIMRAFGYIARALGHPVPGVAHVHVPLNTLVWATSVHIQRIPRAPTIQAISARTQGTIARLEVAGRRTAEA